MSIQINSVGYTKCPEGWSWDTAEHHWIDTDLWIVTGGHGTIEATERVYDISRGDCFLFHGGKRYVGQQDPDNRLSVIHIHFECDEGFLSKFHRYILRPDFAIGIAERVIHYANVYGVNSPRVQRWMKVLLEEIAHIDEIQAVNKACSDHQKLVAEACDFITGDYSVQHKVRELAGRYGYSQDHFTRIFKGQMGITPEQYMISKRIQYASNLLNESNLTINTISQLAGYKDGEYFTKQFKATTGRSPSVYRKKK